MIEKETQRGPIRFTNSLLFFFFNSLFSFLLLFLLLYWSLFHFLDSLLINCFCQCFFELFSLILICSVLGGTDLCKPLFWCLFIRFALIGKETILDKLFL